MREAAKWLQGLGFTEPIVGDSGNGYHLWSDTYDRPMTDLFIVDDDDQTPGADVFYCIPDGIKRAGVAATGFFGPHDQKR